jgi:hypothetical protein
MARLVNLVIYLFKHIRKILELEIKNCTTELITFLRLNPLEIIKTKTKSKLYGNGWWDYDYYQHKHDE